MCLRFRFQILCVSDEEFNSKLVMTLPLPSGEARLEIMSWGGPSTGTLKDLRMWINNLISIPIWF